jgi:hypothetical protein
MSVGSIGSSPSFYQQDQNYWNEAQAQSQASSADDALINVMGQAETNLAKGLASIANQTALNRVNSKISALVEQLLNPSGSSTSSSSSNTAASSSSSSSTAGSPATGIGTARLTTGTSLSSLGILPGGTITVSAANNATTYKSTGTDTVGDLINAINIDLPTNAQVTASLNGSGQLVITSRNDSDSIAIVGSGTDATAIGFGAGNAGFQPTAPSSGSSAASSSATSSTASTSSASSSASSSTSSSKALPSLVAMTEQSLSTAAGILSADGVGGTLVDLLA